MELVTSTEVAKLLADQQGICVSIYLPTHRTGGAEQDPIRLKNLLRDVETKLTARGERSVEVRQWLQRGHDLVGDKQFWQTQGDGLAVFLDNLGSFRSHRLPLAFKELTVVGERYHIKPLLPLLTGSGNFYILALSHNAARLLVATPHQVRRMRPEGMPSGLEEALRFENPGTAPHMRPGISPPGGGRYGQLFHGHGGEGDADKDRIERYCLEIAHSLQPLLQRELAPLVLAGVDYIQALYRSVSAYPMLVEGGVKGNPDMVSDDLLHAQALPVVAPVFLREQELAIARYDRLAEHGMTSNRLDDVVAAARVGRVAVLFVATGVEVWGRMAGEHEQVEQHERAQPGDEEVLDYVAAQTLRHRGIVYALERAHLPHKASGAPLAAILRY